MVFIKIRNIYIINKRIIKGFFIYNIIFNIFNNIFKIKIKIKIYFILKIFILNLF